MLVDKLIKMTVLHPCEIIVVEETDGPNCLPGIIYISHPVKNKGIAYARNLALTKASGELIVFIDDDCTPEDGWIDKLIDPFEDSTIIGVQGGVSIPANASAIGWAETLLGFPGGGIKRIIEAAGTHPRTIEISTLNCAYRRPVLDRIGGFDEYLRHGGEDYVFAKQACKLGGCRFVPGALVLHNPRGSMRNIWTWFVRRGRAEIDTIRVGKQDQMTLPRIAKHSLSLKLIALLLFGMFVPLPAWLFYSLVFLLHTGFQYRRYYSVWEKSRAPVSSFLVLPAVKLVMDFASDWGRARELTCG
jgi:GT2 family glycosyltransferase